MPTGPSALARRDQRRAPKQATTRMAFVRMRSRRLSRFARKRDGLNPRTRRAATQTPRATFSVLLGLGPLGLGPLGLGPLGPYHRSQRWPRKRPSADDQALGGTLRYAAARQDAPSSPEKLPLLLFALFAARSPCGGALRRMRIERIERPPIERRHSPGGRRRRGPLRSSGRRRRRRRERSR